MAKGARVRYKVSSDIQRVGFKNWFRAARFSRYWRDARTEVRALNKIWGKK